MQTNKQEGQAILLALMGDVILNNIYDLVFALKTYAPLGYRRSEIHSRGWKW